MSSKHTWYACWAFRFNFRAPTVESEIGQFWVFNETLQSDVNYVPGPLQEKKSCLEGLSLSNSRVVKSWFKQLLIIQYYFTAVVLFVGRFIRCHILTIPFIRAMGLATDAMGCQLPRSQQGAQAGRAGCPIMQRWYCFVNRISRTTDVPIAPSGNSGKNAKSLKSGVITDSS